MIESDQYTNIFTDVADAGQDLLDQRGGQFSTFSDRPVIDSCRDLVSSIGEATGTALAREVVQRFEAMIWEDKLVFFRDLRAVFSPNPGEVASAIENYQDQQCEEAMQLLAAKLEAPRQELFRRINVAPGGTAALVRLRSDLQTALKAEPELRVVDNDLKHLLSSWFNRGFLDVRQIDWRTPAVVLEKLIAYEAVHAIRGWEDLRRRLAADRRCFGFFHPALPEEPLIFVEVAFVNGISAKIQPLIDSETPQVNPRDADTAIFYSISNCQNGLRGISFGNFLIKQVVAEIYRQMPNIQTFSTLSPIPGFRRWLNMSIEDHDIEEPRINHRGLRALLNDPSWITDTGINPQLEPVVLRLCARYLIQAKSRGAPADPVARFHLNNGARLERINWQADLSDHGLARSAGMMVNYLYRPQDIIPNHEALAHNGKVITSAEVSALVNPP